ncbi:hypothetical protein ACQKNG_07635 [Bacillus cereus]|uniref:hypothetical protein n=1 Tax=Bacillus cereus TaxID=1396 RepID=UPI003D03EA28
MYTSIYESMLLIVIMLLFYSNSTQLRYLVPVGPSIVFFTYRPTVLKVSKIQEFFELNEFGKMLKRTTTKTKIQYDGQSIYRINQKIQHNSINKNDGFYLDNLHKDHIEVIDKQGIVKIVLNLDGSINWDKTEDVLKDKRSVKKGW